MPTNRSGSALSSNVIATASVKKKKNVVKEMCSNYRIILKNVNNHDTFLKHYTYKYNVFLELIYT